jgi:hypothetical protein
MVALALTLHLVGRVVPQVRGGGLAGHRTSNPTPLLRSDPPYKGEGKARRWRSLA